jgi:hypothetical protein
MELPQMDAAVRSFLASLPPFALNPKPLPPIIENHLRIFQGRLIAQAGAEVLFLPPYSPEFSPIEKMWSKLKASLRSAQARTQPALIKAIASALESVHMPGRHQLVCPLWL